MNFDICGFQIREFILEIRGINSLPNFSIPFLLRFVFISDSGPIPNQTQLRFGHSDI